MVNRGWRFDSYRHALAAKGVRTNHVYMRRKNPFGAGARTPTGMPVQFSEPQPKPLEPIEKRLLSYSVYDVFRDDPANLAKARTIIGDISEIERQRAGIEKQFTRSQQSRAVAELTAEKAVLETDLEDAAGAEKERLQSQLQMVDARLAGLRTLNDPYDPSAGSTSELDEFSRLTKEKTLKERELTRLLGFNIEGGIMGSASRVSPSEIERAARARMAMGRLPDTPENREKMIKLSDIVVPKTRSGDIMVPSSPTRMRALGRAAEIEEKLAARPGPRELPVAKGLRGSKDDRVNLNLGSKVPGSMGDSVSIDENPQKKARQQKEYE